MPATTSWRSPSAYRGADDGAVWRLAIADDRILVARDLDFPLPKRLGRPSGLVLVRPRQHARGAQIRRLFTEFIGRVDPESLRGAVTTVEPGRIRQRRYEDLPW